MPRTVLVTGASSGIGAAVAQLLSVRGFTVFGTTRGTSGPRDYQMLRLDVRSDESVRASLDEIRARAGRLDLVVNNAGYALTGAAEETSLAEARAQFDTNFFGTVRVVNAVLPGMREAGAGRIVNIGSLAGLTAVPFSAFYSATKFALEAYSEALWHELRPLGISVSLIEPGFVRTELGHASVAPAEPISAYDTVRTRAVAVVNRAIEEGISPDLVAEAVLEAAESPEPRLRYPVGSAARWVPRVRNLAPWSFYASAVRKRFELETTR